MAMQLSQAEVMDLRSKAMSAISRARTALQKADVVVEKVTHAMVTAGTAFAFGIAQGRYAGIQIVGVPADLGAGVVLHALGFVGIGGKGAEYMHAAGNGALASYLTGLGRGIGQEWRAKAGGGTLPAAASGQTISDAELARLARGGV